MRATVMKNKNLKRIVSLTLAVIVICSMSANAMADTRTVSVVVKSGDTLYSICNQYGINYYKSKDAIMRLNNYSDSRMLDRIKAGSTILLPVSGSSARNGSSNIQVISNGSSGTQRSGPVSLVAGDASKMSMSDRVAYYLVLYSIKSGDTLISLYSQWGMDFSTYQSQIKSLNGMTNLDRLVVGKMLYLPVNRGDIQGAANYAIIEHTITSGETVYGICSSYGLDYNKASLSLQCFNRNMDFTRIRVGQKLYIPVAWTASGTAGGGTGLLPSYPSGGTIILPSNPTTPAAPGTIPAVTPANPSVSLPTSTVYDGYAVIKSSSGYLALRLENPALDVNVAYTAQSLANYTPRPGDYVHVVFTPTDFLLVSIQYVYNVFTGR